MPRGKIDAQPAYILHTYPYRETSLIVEAFTQDYGRIALLARGARRPRSAMRGLLMGFQPLEIGWAGKGEVLTLMKIEWQGGQPLLFGPALFCGYYLNELLLHLLPREDAHQRLFGRYSEMLHNLAKHPNGKVEESDLRQFEKALLQELGYGLTLDVDQAGRPIASEAQYAYDIEHGPRKVESQFKGEQVYFGRSLLDLAAEEFSLPRSRMEVKILMRSLMGYYLGGVELETRKIFRELQAYETVPTLTTFLASSGGASLPQSSLSGDLT